jgi:thiamine kinase-like enzyme
LEETPWSVIRRIPQWRGVEGISVEQIGGLTNQNYLISVSDERFVLRVGGSNSLYLGINREFELEALKVASNAGLGPDVVEYILPEGHLVTRFAEGRHWSAEEFRTKEAIAAIVEAVKRLHSLPRIRAEASPFRRVRRYAEEATRLDVPLPEHIDGLLETVSQVELDQLEDREYTPVFTHNDLVTVNIIQSTTTGSITLLDFEFAGMGDPYHDLASLVYCHDNIGPIPAELEEFLLMSYFGEVTPQCRLRLAGMKFMLMLFFAMWGFVQHGLTEAGIVDAVDDFDYLDYARYLIDHDVADCASSYRDLQQREP